MRSHRLPLLALAAALAACASSPEARAPGELVELFDLVASDGAMEIEFGRDGSFGDVEAEVPVETVPRAIREAVEAAHPGATLTGAEREVQGGDWTWEVGFERDGRGVQLVIDDAGRILETERELTPAEAPLGVLHAAEVAVPSSTLASVDVVTSDDGDEYHVKRERDGARFKVILSPSGNVLRVVREVRAELEIPVAD